MEAQTKYPDVSFILVDAEPKDKDGNVQIEDNVMSIMYAEEQAGYLAGYAAVTEGTRTLDLWVVSRYLQLSATDMDLFREQMQQQKIWDSKQGISK